MAPPQKRFRRAQRHNSAAGGILGQQSEGGIFSYSENPRAMEKGPAVGSLKWLLGRRAFISKGHPSENSGTRDGAAAIGEQAG